jgi:2-hydroxy-3-oxopropionate reductase
MQETVGFIGLGAMGKPMAANLVKAGFDVVVHSRSRPPIDELVAAGAREAASPAQVAAAAAIVITILPDTPDVEAVVAGEGGVLEGAREGTLVIDMSTISPTASTALAAAAQARGARMLDAPVSGGDVGAQNATLSIMAGGAAEDFERARPVFEALGRTIVHVGPSGAGQIAKACNQIVVAGTIAAISEALTLAEKAGIELQTVVDVLRGGFAGSKVLDVRGSNFVSHSFEPGFRAELHLKDLGIALSAGQAYGVPLPSTAVVTQLFAALKARGHGAKDHSGLMLLIEELAATGSSM